MYIESSLLHPSMWFHDQILHEQENLTFAPNIASCHALNVQLSSQQPCIQAYVHTSFKQAYIVEYEHSLNNPCIIIIIH